MALSYLTVQDVLLICFKVTKRNQAFDALTLEEATFFQYAPGQSTDLVGQAARFLTGFAKKAPFAVGSDAVAFAALLVFLEANGKTLRLLDDEAADWVRALLAGGGEARGSISERLVDAALHLEHGVPNLEAICESVVSRFPDSLSALMSQQAAAS